MSKCSTCELYLKIPHNKTIYGTHNRLYKMREYLVITQTICTCKTDCVKLKVTLMCQSDQYSSSDLLSILFLQKLTYLSMLNVDF